MNRNQKKTEWNNSANEIEATRFVQGVGRRRDLRYQKGLIGCLVLLALVVSGCSGDPEIVEVPVEVLVESIERDVHGNTVAEAASVTLSHLTGGGIETPGDVDVFHVSAPYAGELRVSLISLSEEAGDLQMRLLSAGEIPLLEESGTVIERLYDVVIAGDYYVEVKHVVAETRGGRYALVVSVDDYEDEMIEASEKSWVTDETGTKLLLSIEGILEEERDRDIFQLQVPEDGELSGGFTVSAEGNGGESIPQWRLLGENGELLEGSRLSGGMYYVEVYGGSESGAEPYVLDLEYVLGRGVDQAEELLVSSFFFEERNGRVETEEDVDYYQVEIERQGIVNLRVEGEETTIARLDVSLLDEGLAEVGIDPAEFEVGEGPAETFLEVEKNLEEGVYYFGVRKKADTGRFSEEEGFYTVRAEIVNEDIGDDAESATVLLEAGDISASTIGLIEQVGDIDYYSLVFEREGILSIELKGEVNNLSFFLEDENEEGIGRGSVVNGQERLETPVGIGLYYVYVTGGDVLPYEMRVDFVPNRIGGNNIVNAFVLGASEEIAYALPLRTDVDYWKLDTSNSGVLSVTNTGEVDVEIVDGDDNVVQDNDLIDVISMGVTNIGIRGDESYYLRVRNNKIEGNEIVFYTITTSFVSDPSSSSKNPQVLLGSTFPFERHEAIQVNEDIDYYFFPMRLIEGGTLTVYGIGDVEVMGSVNVDSSTRASDDTPTNETNFYIEYEIPRTGEYPEYLIRVQGKDGARGFYTLHVEWEDPREDVEISEFPYQGEHSIEKAGESDRYKLQFNSGGSGRLLIYTTGGVSVEGALTEDGSDLASATGGGIGGNFSIDESITIDLDSEYILTVTGDGTSVGPYVLNIQWEYEDSVYETTITQVGNGDRGDFRIPSLVQAPNSDFLYFIEHRQQERDSKPWHPDFVDRRDSDIDMYRSTNLGETWSSGSTIIRPEGTPRPEYISYQDPSTVVWEGNVLLFYIDIRGETYNRGKSYRDTNFIQYMTYSTNSGVSWSTSEFLFDEGESGTNRFGSEFKSGHNSPGNGIIIQNGPYRGRAVVPFIINRTDGNAYYQSFYCDSACTNGLNWSLGSGISIVTSGDRRVGPNEPQIVEVGKRGRLAIITRVRASADPKNTWIAFSAHSDNGGVTFDYGPGEGVVLSGSSSQPGDGLTERFTGPTQSGLVRIGDYVYYGTSVSRNSRKFGYVHRIKAETDVDFATGEWNEAYFITSGGFANTSLIGFNRNGEDYVGMMWEKTARNDVHVGVEDMVFTAIKTEALRPISEFGDYVDPPDGDLGW